MEQTLTNILIIEDEPDIGCIVKMALEFNGYSVLLLKNAADCIEYIKSNNINLIIMDLLISGVYGVDVCKLSKADTSLSFIPVMMMSAHPDAKQICIEAGADDFIAKPFDISELLAKVKIQSAKINSINPLTKQH
jgi:DNA-binding response OmpR family regulator